MVITRTGDYRYHIGIDPGSNTGVALWDRKEQRLVFIESMLAVEAEEYVLDFFNKNQDAGVCVHVEDTRNLRLPKSKQKHASGAMDLNVGKVHRDMSRWEEYLRHKGIHHIMRPLTKSNLRKSTQELFNAVTGWHGRSSEHARDAAAYVWGIM